MKFFSCMWMMLFFDGKEAVLIWIIKKGKSVTMSFCIVNRNGFINAFLLLFIAFLLIAAQLYVARYKTLAELRKLSQGGYYCELFIFHHINEHFYKMDLDTVEEGEITDGDKRKEVENLTFRECGISLEYEDDQVRAMYTLRSLQQHLHILLDPDTKEILDIVYENEYDPQ